MKKMWKILMVIGTLVSLLFPLTGATPHVWHNFPKTGTDVGEIFVLKFEISSDETTNYTIVLDTGTKFSVVDGNTSMTYTIPKNETRTYIFNLKIEEKLQDGKYPIHYEAFKNGTSFKSGNAYVRAGQQAPGFELIAAISAIAIAIFLRKKKK